MLSRGFDALRHGMGTADTKPSREIAASKTHLDFHRGRKQVKETCNPTGPSGSTSHETQQAGDSGVGDGNDRAILEELD